MDGIAEEKSNNADKPLFDDALLDEDADESGLDDALLPGVLFGRTSVMEEFVDSTPSGSLRVLARWIGLITFIFIAYRLLPSSSRYYPSGRKPNFESKLQVKWTRELVDNGDKMQP